MGQSSNVTTQEIDPDIKYRQLDLYNQAQQYTAATPWQQYPYQQVSPFQPFQLAGMGMLADAIFGPGTFSSLGFQSPTLGQFNQSWQPTVYQGGSSVSPDGYSQGDGSTTTGTAKPRDPTSPPQTGNPEDQQNWDVQRNAIDGFSLSGDMVSAPSVAGVGGGGTPTADYDRLAYARSIYPWLAPNAYVSGNTVIEPGAGMNDGQPDDLIHHPFWPEQWATAGNMAQDPSANQLGDPTQVYGGTATSGGGLPGYPGMYGDPYTANALFSSPISVDNGQGGSVGAGGVVVGPGGGGPDDPGSPNYVDPWPYPPLPTGGQGPTGPWGPQPPTDGGGDQGSYPGGGGIGGQMPPFSVNPNAAGMVGSTSLPGSGGFQIPGFNTQNALGLSQINDAANAAGVQQWMTPSASPFYNPFVSDVINTTMSDLDRARQGLVADNASYATQAGAFGGDRQAILDSETNRNYLDSVGRFSAQLRSAGFDTANQLAQQNAQRQLQAAGLYGGLGSALQSGVMGYANALSGFGNQQQMQSQNMIDRNISDFYAARNYPIQGFQLQQGILQGMPAGFSMTQPGQSPWQGLLGGALQLGSLFL